MMQPYRYPFAPYPLGWYEVCYSRELLPGSSKPLKVFGLELVLFRSESGKSSVLDAICPHLGAHMGHGSTVAGENLVCPFHRWEFDCTGQCTSIPYSEKKIPKKAKVKTWHVKEINGSIFVWYHPSDAAPSFELPYVPEVDSEDWTPFWSVDRTVEFHCQEIRENGVDAYHFLTVHGLPPNLLTVRTDKHILIQESSLDIQVGDEKPVGSELSVEFYGLGYAVARHTMPGISTLVLSHITPIDENTSRLRFSISMKRVSDLKALWHVSRWMREAEGDITPGAIPTKSSIRRMLRAAPVKDIFTSLRRMASSLKPKESLQGLLTHLIVIPAAAEVARQLDQDIFITERKAYLTSPIYRDGEQPIHQMRKWAKQFYAEAPSTPTAQAGSKPTESALFN